MVMILQVSSPAHLSSHRMWESSLQVANRHKSRNFLPWDSLKGMHMFTQVGIMKWAKVLHLKHFPFQSGGVWVLRRVISSCGL